MEWYRCSELTGRDTLDTSTAGETANRGLRNSLDIVTQDLAVTLGSALSESLSTFSAYENEYVSILSENQYK